VSWYLRLFQLTFVIRCWYRLSILQVGRSGCVVVLHFYRRGGCDCIFVYRRSSLLSHRCLDARRFFSRVVQLLFFTSLLHSSSSSHPRTIIHRWLFPMDTSPSSLFRLPLAALAASMDACVVPMGGFRSHFEISNSIFFQGWCVRPCELFCCFVPSGGIQPSSFVSHTPLFLGN